MTAALRTSFLWTLLFAGCSLSATIQVNPAPAPSPVMPSPGAQAKGVPPASETLLQEPADRRWLSLDRKVRVSNREIALFSWTQLYAASRGYRLGSGAYENFKKFSATAAEDIEGSASDDRTARLREAGRNLAGLVDRMIIEASSIPDYETKNPGVIGEDTLLQALRKLCPIWPVCKEAQP
jgi:hypothetical protein